jgi:hypothetical protein
MDPRVFGRSPKPLGKLLVSIEISPAVEAKCSRLTEGTDTLLVFIGMNSCGNDF